MIIDEYMNPPVPIGPGPCPTPGCVELEDGSSPTGQCMKCVEQVYKLEQLKLDANGFKGRFLFMPAHNKDRGVGLVSDWTNFDARLVFVPEEYDCEDPDIDNCSTIADGIEAHIAIPIARLLNAALADYSDPG